jgi:hypothetical protein
MQPTEIFTDPKVVDKSWEKKENDTRVNTIFSESKNSQPHHEMTCKLRDRAGGICRL